MGATATALPPTGMTERTAKRPYFLVFIVLGAVTLVELFANSFGLPHLATITLLVVLATIKGSLVVAYYMHLRYEPRWLGLIPLAGLALVAVLVAALTATVAQP